MIREKQHVEKKIIKKQILDHHNDLQRVYLSVKIHTFLWPWKNALFTKRVIWLWSLIILLYYRQKPGCSWLK